MGLVWTPYYLLFVYFSIFKRTLGHHEQRYMGPSGGIFYFYPQPKNWLYGCNKFLYGYKFLLKSLLFIFIFFYLISLSYIKEQINWKIYIYIFILIFELSYEYPIIITFFLFNLFYLFSKTRSSTSYVLKIYIYHRCTH